eukprot:contig_24242_g5974
MSDPQEPRGVDDLPFEEVEMEDDVPVGPTAAECFLASSSEDNEAGVTVRMSAGRL